MRRKAQKNKVIYLDNAATTPTKEEVVKEMLPYFTNIYSNPSAVYGFAGKSVVALDNARRKLAEVMGAKPEDIERETMLRDRLIERVLSEIPDVKLNGSHKKRLPGNASFCIKGVQGESLLILLDQKHICVSCGSACTSGSLDPSYVLMAMGLSDESASSSLRITLSSDNTPEQIDYVVDELKTIVSGLRN